MEDGQSLSRFCRRQTGLTLVSGGQIVLESPGCMGSAGGCRAAPQCEHQRRLSQTPSRPKKSVPLFALRDRSEQREPWGPPGARYAVLFWGHQPAPVKRVTWLMTCSAVALGNNCCVSESRDALSCRGASQPALGCPCPQLPCLEKISPWKVNSGGLNLSKSGDGAGGPENTVIITGGPVVPLGHKQAYYPSE